MSTLPFPRILLLATFLSAAAPLAAEEPAAQLDPAVDAALADAHVKGDAAPAAGDAVAAAAGASAGDAAGALLDPMQSSFNRFCGEWMEKLAARERRNQGLIEWQTGTNWVQGSYVGYTREHKCSIEGANSAAPVGRLSYLEVRYERRGASVPDAMVADPRPVETTEVTEFFRYSDEGEWVY